MRLNGSFIVVASITLMAFQPVHAAWYTRGHAVNTLNLPVTSNEATSYAIDLNGDGSPENYFGSVLATMATVGLDLLGGMAAEVAAGQIVHLIELRSTDAAFANDVAAEATWYVGEATMAPPLFDGSDTFRFDDAFAPAPYVAALTSSNFVSANPATSSTSTNLTILIAMGSTTFSLPLQGSRLKFTATAGGLSQGQINGSIRKDDIDNVFVPAMASYFNELVQADPKSDTAMTLLGLYDTDPTDGAISVQEVATNPLIISLLAPDVDIFDANDNYAPNPANTAKDSMSFGFGFTAVVSQTILERIFDNGFEQ